MSKNIFKTVIAVFVAVAMSAMFSLSAFAASHAKDLNGKVCSYSYVSAPGAEVVCCEDGGPHCDTNTVTNTKSSEDAIYDLTLAACEQRLSELRELEAKVPNVRVKLYANALDVAIKNAKAQKTARDSMMTSVAPLTVLF